MKRLLSSCLGLLFVSIFLFLSSLNAQTGDKPYKYIFGGNVTNASKNGPPIFDCESLYVVDQWFGGWGLAHTGLCITTYEDGKNGRTCNERWVYKVNFDSNRNYTGSTRVFAPTGTSLTIDTNTSHGFSQIDTIALGRAGGDDNNPLTMFGWKGYNSRLWESGKSISIYGFESNSTQAKLLMPGFPFAVLLRGGEMEQKTGYLYMEGNDDKRLLKYMYDFKLVVFDPVTNQLKKFTTGFEPATPADAFASDGIGTQIESDIAIDAEGNAYLFVSRGTDIFTLIKVDVPYEDLNWTTSTKDSVNFGNNDNNSFKNYKTPHSCDNRGQSPTYNGKGCVQPPWKYHRIMDVSISSLGMPRIGGYRPDADQIWGMAFLNGYLYFGIGLTWSHDSWLLELDPLSKKVRYLGNLPIEVYDFASCQTAPLIRGRVFLDEKGNGNPNDFKGTVEDVVVQIYSENGSRLSEVLTSDGQYNFMVPLNKNGTTTYYIRLKQPQIKGANAHQTWASGGTFEWKGGGGRKGVNTVTPNCINPISENRPIAHAPVGRFAGKDVIDYYGTVCDGAKADKIDSSVDSISAAGYFSKVVFGTDMEVPHADFAISPPDRSDAPSPELGAKDKDNKAIGFKEAYHYTFHNKVFLGEGVTADSASKAHINASKDDFDDGVEVKLANSSDSFISLQEAIGNGTNGKRLSMGKSYTYKVKVQGDGYLNAWVNLDAGGLSNTDFKTQIAKDFQDGGVDDGDGAKDGYIHFNYTLPKHRGFANTSRPNIYFRFRFSSSSGTDVFSYTPARNDEHWKAHPWVVDGEVEDYMAELDPLVITPVGALNVVNERFTGNQTRNGTKDNTNSLFTQVSGQKFGVKLLALGDGVVGGYIPLLKWSDYEDNSTTITNISLVDGNTPSGCSVEDSDCCKKAPDLSGTVITPNFIELNKASANVTNATANTTYITYNLNVTTNASVKNAYFKITWTSKDGSNNSVCSMNDFAIRPDRFIVEDSSNRSLVDSELVGGVEYNYTARAVISGSENATAVMYNQNLTASNDTVLVSSPPCDGTALDIPGNITGDANFVNGTTKFTIYYDNVGRVRLSIIDDEWTSVNGRSNDTTTQECIPNSHKSTHLNSRVGCDIAYEDVTLTFIPDHFELVNAEITNFDNGTFTYQIDNADMAASLNYALLAMTASGANASNYHKGCFAKDTDLNMTLSSNPAGWVEDVFRNTTSPNAVERIKFWNGSGTTPSNGTVTFHVAGTEFTRGGTDNLSGKFNFNRIDNRSEEPFTVTGSNFGVTSITDGSVSGAPTGGFGGEAKFYYGRVYSQDYHGVEPINAAINYEVFCLVCDRVEYGDIFGENNINQIGWTVNKEHTSTAHGKVSQFNSTGATTFGTSKTSTAATSAIADGKEFLRLNNGAGYTDYTDYINMNSDPWLKDPIRFPDPSGFKVTFTGGGGGWAGEGKAEDGKKSGRVVDEDTSGRIKTRLDW